MSVLKTCARRLRHIAKAHAQRAQAASRRAASDRALKIMSDAFNTPVSVDPRLLEVLVCPVTRGRLTYDRERNELISAGAKLAFPIRDGVPIMLAEDARPLD